MKHALSTHLFVNHRLTVALLDRIMRAGIPAVEIFCARQHLDYRDRAQIAELAHWFRDSELKLHSLHAPDVHGRHLGPLRAAVRHQHHRAVKGQAHPDDRRDQARARNRRARAVPLPDPAHRRGGRGVRRAQGRGRVHGAGGAGDFRAAARRGDPAGEHPQRPFQRRAADAVRRGDAPQPELLLRHGPRQHGRGRRAGVRA